METRELVRLRSFLSPVDKAVHEIRIDRIKETGEYMVDDNILERYPNDYWQTGSRMYTQSLRKAKKAYMQCLNRLGARM